MARREKEGKKKDKKKIKDDPEAYPSVKESPEAKIEEMLRIIRNLSNTTTRLEVVTQSPSQFPRFAPRKPNSFMRPYNPQILPRDR